MSKAAATAALLTAETSDGRTIEYQEQSFAEGGEKRVHMAADGQQVICFYKQPDSQRRQRLQQIVQVFNPTAQGQSYADYWKSLFCWPTAIIVKPELGVVAPRYPSHFFFPSGKGGLSSRSKDGSWFTSPKTRRVVREQCGAQELGDFRTMLAVATKVARAVRRMHAAGLAHSDLSDRNVLIDPSGGRAIIIDIDSLVVRNLYPPTVLGTRGFIAPEVLATMHLPLNDPQRQHPCIETDLHALACLIYQYLLLRHPLDGPLVCDPDDPDRDDTLRFGAQALFIEHPSDPRNRPKDLRVTIEDLGPYLLPLFLKTFVDGLHRPEGRALAAEWEQACVKTYNVLLPCANKDCEQRYFPAIRASCRESTLTPRRTCPFCGTTAPGSYPLLKLLRCRSGGVYVHDFHLVGYHGCHLFSYHARTDKMPGEALTEADLQPVATIECHQGQWLLRNLRLQGLRSAQGNPVLPGQATRLQAGARIVLDAGDTGRIAEVSLIA